MNHYSVLITIPGFFLSSIDKELIILAESEIQATDLAKKYALDICKGYTIGDPVYLNNLQNRPGIILVKDIK